MKCNLCSDVFTLTAMFLVNKTEMLAYYSYIPQLATFPNSCDQIPSLKAIEEERVYFGPWLEGTAHQNRKAGCQTGEAADRLVSMARKQRETNAGGHPASSIPPFFQHGTPVYGTALLLLGTTSFLSWTPGNILTELPRSVSSR